MKNPSKAISVRQPWAWMIIHGGKDIENRQQRTHFRGRIFIHASKGMTRDEYGWGADFARRCGVNVPAFDELQRGGIIGSVEIVDCVDDDPSPWFFGVYGYILKSPKPAEFQPMNGKLGLFNVEVAP